jgi:hypothetical protein
MQLNTPHIVQLQLFVLDRLLLHLLLQLDLLVLD